MSERLTREQIDELRQLAEKACGDGLDDASRERLNEMRRNSPAARQCYADCLRAAEMGAPGPVRGLPPGAPAPKKPKRRALDILRTVAAVAVAAWFYFTYTEPEKPPLPTDDNAAGTVYLVKKSPRFQVGQPVHRGEAIATQGLVGLQMIRGTAVLVESGALRLDASTSATLMDGTVSLRVDEDSTFSLLTPHGAIEVMPGQCGVIVNLDTTSVHVFGGEVAIEPFVGNKRQVQAGQAMGFGDIDPLITDAVPALFQSQASGPATAVVGSTGTGLNEEGKDANWSWRQAGGFWLPAPVVPTAELPAGASPNTKEAKWIVAESKGVLPGERIYFRTSHQRDAATASLPLRLNLQANGRIDDVAIDAVSVKTPLLPQPADAAPTLAEPLIVPIQDSLSAGTNFIEVAVVNPTPEGAEDPARILLRARYEGPPPAGGNYWPKAGMVLPPPIVPLPVP